MSVHPDWLRDSKATFYAAVHTTTTTLILFGGLLCSLNIVCADTALPLSLYCQFEMYSAFQCIFILFIYF